MNRTLPSQLRDAPCRLAAPGVFDIPPPPSKLISLTRMEKADRRRQIEYAKRYCNGTTTRAACGFRETCLRWALEARERGVAGGVEVTAAMIERHYKAKKEAERATQSEEAGSGGLAESA